MQKWEFCQYDVRYLAHNDIRIAGFGNTEAFKGTSSNEIWKFFERLGDEGWELVGYGGPNGLVYTFKRPKN
jgi:hypothetical protein